MILMDENIEEYARKNSTPPSELLNELEKETYEKMELPQMLTGPIEGRFLKLLIQMLQAKRVLEIGMFTGYGTLSIAEGLPENGKIITCELEPNHIKFAKEFFKRSPHRNKIEIREGEALKILRQLDPPFDFIFIDAHKPEYPQYYEESLRLLRKGGVMALDNMLWGGEVLNPKDESSQAIAKLNQKISQDLRVEGVLLTVRDGIFLVQKK